jgi:hypothetical protein
MEVGVERMTDREKLVELLNKAHAEYYTKCDFSKGYMETLADYLLANGVAFAKPPLDTTNQAADL